MKALLVCPEYPDTFWSFKHALRFLSKRAGQPPLGLLTVASLLPAGWEKRLIDLNLRPLTAEDLRWADYVFLAWPQCVHVLPPSRSPAVMDLFIVEESIPVRERLVRTLEGLEGLDIVGTAEDVPCRHRRPDPFRARRPDPRPAAAQRKRAAGAARSAREAPRHARHRHDQLRRRALSQSRPGPGAEVFLDKSADFGRVRDILSGWRDEAASGALH